MLKYCPMRGSFLGTARADPMTGLRLRETLRCLRGLLLRLRCLRLRGFWTSRSPTLWYPLGIPLRDLRRALRLRALAFRLTALRFPYFLRLQPLRAALRCPAALLVQTFLRLRLRRGGLLLALDTLRVLRLEDFLRLAALALARDLSLCLRILRALALRLPQPFLAAFLWPRLSSNHTFARRRLLRVFAIFSFPPVCELLELTNL